MMRHSLGGWRSGEEMTTPANRARIRGGTSSELRPRTATVRTPLSQLSSTERTAWGLRHDLAAPLTSIVLAAELLQQTGRLAARRRGVAIETIQRSALWIGMILEDNFENKDVTGHSGQPTEILECVSTVTKMLLPMLEQRGQTVRVTDTFLQTSTPRSVLQRILMNLIVNASKYGPRNDEIEIVATAVDNVVRIAVRDHGDGFSTSDGADVFEWGVRGKDALKGTQAGLGIGLSMVRELVLSQGGDIRVETSGHGCEASFTLPMCACEPVANA